MPENGGNAIRLLAIIEAYTLSGPAKNLLEFCRLATSMSPQPPVVISVATFVRGNPENEFLQVTRAAGVEVHEIAERFAFDPRTIRALRHMVARLSPDLVQTHGTKSHFLLRLSGIWRQYPWIAFHHGYTTDARRTKIYNQLDRWSLRAATQIVTVCQPFKRQLAARGAPAERIAVLHNAISEDWLGVTTPNNQTSVADVSRPRTMLAVGRLSREKAFHHLIASMQELRRLAPQLPVRLIILGDGPERRYLERRLAAANLQDRVTLQGHVSDVRPYFQGADLLAVSSLSEGSPNALLEAMCAGVPVVATDVGGIPEIINHRETGLLVPPANPRAMASAVAAVLQDANFAQKLACRARELVRARYSPETRARALIELYSRLCPGKQRMETQMVEELPGALPTANGKRL